MRETVEVDARIARNLINSTEADNARPATARAIRNAAKEVREVADGFGSAEVPAYELTWLVAEAARSDQVARAAIREGREALEEAEVW
jgi:hypothetical protein